MYIHNITINNLLSIENASIDFELSGLTLIEGWNVDDNRASGAGKTAILNAISYAIYDKVPRKITKTEILRKGTKSGYAECTVSIHGVYYKVKRSRPSGFEVFKIDSNSAWTLIQMSPEEFEAILDISYEQFITTMYSAQNSSNKFITLNDNDKKDFILNLMKLGKFDNYHTASKAHTNSLLSNIESKNSEISNLKSKIDAYSQSIVDTTEYSKIIENNLIDIDNINKEIITLQNIQKPDLSAYKKYDDQITSAMSKIYSARSMRDTLYNQFNQLKREISKPFIFNKPTKDCDCPECNTPLTIHGKVAIKLQDTSEQEKQALQAHNIKVKDMEDNCSKLLESINIYDTEIQKEKSILDFKSKLEDKKSKEFTTYNNAIKMIGEYNRSLTMKNQQNSFLQENIAKNNTLTKKIEECSNVLISLTSDVESLSSNLEISKTLSHIFSPTGAPAYIMDTIIDLLNEAVSNYVSMIWSNAKYELQTSKVNKDGKTTTKFSESLIINGLERSIGSLSGGELRSLSLAVDFAILEVMIQQFNIQLNPIFLDEPFDGLDAVGREIVVNLLYKLSTTYNIIVIDHASNVQAMFSNVIRVEKRNGISKVM